MYILEKDDIVLPEKRKREFIEKIASFQDQQEKVDFFKDSGDDLWELGPNKANVKSCKCELITGVKRLSVFRSFLV